MVCVIDSASGKFHSTRWNICISVVHMPIQLRCEMTSSKDGPVVIISTLVMCKPKYLSYRSWLGMAILRAVETYRCHVVVMCQLVCRLKHNDIGRWNHLRNSNLPYIWILASATGQVMKEACERQSGHSLGASSLRAEAHNSERYSTLSMTL